MTRKPSLERQFLTQLACHQWSQHTLTEQVNQTIAATDRNDTQGAIAHLCQNRRAHIWPWALIAGITLGGATMTGLLNYSGEQPINIVWLLLFFVVFPWILLIISWLLMAFKGSPGLWRQLPFFKRLPSSLILPPARFYLHWLNQWFGLGFSLGGLIILLAMVVGLDLAFGWATTLSTEPQTVHQLTERLSYPWQSWLPDARPTLDLIEHSQFFRWQAERDQLDPNLLRQWWPFVTMMLVSYSLLPRLLSLPLSHMVFKRQLAQHWPSTPALAQRAYAIAQAKDNTASHPRTKVSIAQLDKPYIGWRLSNKDHRLLDYGLGLGTLNEDMHQIKSLESKRKLTVWVKGYESPQLELADLLKPLNTQITLALYSPKAISDASYISWERFAKQHGYQMAEIEGTS